MGHTQPLPSSYMCKYCKTTARHADVASRFFRFDPGMVRILNYWCTSIVYHICDNHCPTHAWPSCGDHFCWLILSLRLFIDSAWPKYSHALLGAQIAAEASRARLTTSKFANASLNNRRGAYNSPVSRGLQVRPLSR